MSLNRMHLIIVVTWSVVMLTALGLRLWLFGPISGTVAFVWLLLAVAPAVILVTVFRGAGSPSIAKVLYDAEQAGVAPGPPRAPDKERTHAGR